jgi:hypothetical protein
MCLVLDSRMLSERRIENVCSPALFYGTFSALALKNRRKLGKNSFRIAEIVRDFNLRSPEFDIGVFTKFCLQKIKPRVELVSSAKTKSSKVRKNMTPWGFKLNLYMVPIPYCSGYMNILNNKLIPKILKVCACPSGLLNQCLANFGILIYPRAWYHPDTSSPGNSAIRNHVNRTCLSWFPVLNELEKSVNRQRKKGVTCKADGDIWNKYFL